MESAVGPVSTMILLFIAFVVPLVVVVSDDRIWHRGKPAH